MRFNWRHLASILALGVALTVYCEYLVYYAVLWQCHWPDLAEDHSHHDAVHTMFVADTHLLGSRQGHWFDKLRREWQMHRAFTTAMAYFEPEVVFFLGDLLDEGKWASADEFKSTLERFHSLFKAETKYAVAGNHDIGFHYSITPYLRKRFYEGMNLKPQQAGVRRVTIKNVHFVLVDSMAMHGDGCFFCAPAKKRIVTVSKELSCMKNKDKCELKYEEEFSKPILLQHFPLYRKSDAQCHDEPDAAQGKDKDRKFRPQWDCVSEESSMYLLEKLRPRLVLSGHTHNGCRTSHTLNDGQLVPEWSVSSFSWRNRNNPAFVLATITPDEFVLNKCYLPQESSVINMYILGAIIIMCYVIVTRRKFFRRF